MATHTSFRRIHSAIRVAALFSLVSAASCSSAQAGLSTPTVEWDGGFLSQDPCGPPCYGGVTPGTTTEQEALALAEPSRFGTCAVHDNPSQGRFIQCSRAVFVVDVSDGTILQVGFQTPASITIEDVINQYGEPQYIDVGEAGSPDFPITAMSVYFESLNATLALEEQEGIGYTVSPSTPVSAIWYGPTPVFPGWKLPWHGYGEYRRSP
jgi:hypothetical protein